MKISIPMDLADRDGRGCVRLLVNTDEPYSDEAADRYGHAIQHRFNTYDKLLEAFKNIGEWANSQDGSHETMQVSIWKIAGLAGGAVRIAEEVKG